MFDLIFDFHDWFALRKAGKYQQRADEQKATMDYWRQIGASLNTFYNGQEQADGPIPGMHEASLQYHKAKRERDRCLAKAAKLRVG